jgi:hypothetical protein
MSDQPLTPTAARTPPRFAPRPADDPTYNVDPGRGWVLFAGVMLSIVGVLNLIYGIAAIGDSTFFVNDVKYVFGDLNTWGWFLTFVGAFQAVTAIGVFLSLEAARWAGIACAAVNMLVQFLVLPAQPVWAIMVFFVDVIIIFGLVTYGGRNRHNFA